MLADVSTRRLMAYETKRLLYFNCLIITVNDLFLEIPRTEKKKTFYWLVCSQVTSKEMVTG